MIPKKVLKIYQPADVSAEWWILPSICEKIPTIADFSVINKTEDHNAGRLQRQNHVAVFSSQLPDHLPNNDG